MRAVRSVLFLPASNPRAIEKARGLDCDIAILDLEDAVAPEAKAEARRAAVEAMRAGGFRPRLGVRVNGLKTDWGADDLAAVGEARADFVVVPKVEGETALQQASERLGAAVKLWAMVETPLGAVQLPRLGAFPGALEALVLGVNDLSEGLCVGPSPDREPIKPWLTATVGVARANGLLAIDGVFNAHSDAEGFAAEAAQARLYGFHGKSLIHPSQIAPCHAAFAPTAKQIAHARAVVAAFAAPEAQGRGAISLDGRMIERLHLTAAERLLSTVDGDTPI